MRLSAKPDIASDSAPPPPPKPAKDMELKEFDVDESVLLAFEELVGKEEARCRLYVLYVCSLYR